VRRHWAAFRGESERHFAILSVEAKLRNMERAIVSASMSRRVASIDAIAIPNTGCDSAVPSRLEAAEQVIHHFRDHRSRMLLPLAPVR
jgi:hypothetical protein